MRTDFRQFRIVPLTLKLYEYLATSFQIYKRKSKDPREIEHIIYDVWSGNAFFLHSTDFDSKDFATCHIETDPITNQPSLFIDCAFSADGDAVEKYEDSWIELAKELNCSSIRFASRRKGWRVSDKYSIEATTYRRDISK